MNDILYGGTGNDKLYGGDGDDYLYSGSGLDYLYGNNGNDSFSDIKDSILTEVQETIFKANNEVADARGLANYASAEGGTSFAEIWTPENSYNPDLSSYDKLIYNIRGGDGNDYLWIDSIDVFNWAVNHGSLFQRRGWERCSSI